MTEINTATLAWLYRAARQIHEETNYSSREAAIVGKQYMNIAAEALGYTERWIAREWSAELYHEAGITDQRWNVVRDVD